jgi:hypothetical protein
MPAPTLSFMLGKPAMRTVDTGAAMSARNLEMLVVFTAPCLPTKPRARDR